MATNGKASNLTGNGLVADMSLLQSADNEPYQVACWGAGGTSTRSPQTVNLDL
jgi:hypothetical protein